MTSPGEPLGVLDPSVQEPVLLQVAGLEVDFANGGRTVHAVRGISYSLHDGESLGLVGESGSGKSVSALALVGLLPGRSASVRGSVLYQGTELLHASEKRLRQVRGTNLAFVFQDPLSSLDPVLSIGSQISEQLRAHGRARGRRAKLRAAELLELVGIPDPARRVKQFPHELSGGMRQRAMIAMALSCEPAILVADEPTTALDVTIQAQILEFLVDLRRRRRMSLLLISHDLGVVAGATDRIAVVYAGRIVEVGETNTVLADPAHPYTQGLLRSIPRLDGERDIPLNPIPGSPPDLSLQIKGCPFSPRCQYSQDKCAITEPPLVTIRKDREVACWFPRS